MKNKLIPILILLLAGIWFQGCKDDQPFLTDQVALDIRVDTIFFDTVFTKNGVAEPRSVNKQFTITNPFNSPVKTQIALGSGTQGQFKLNVDGIEVTQPEEFEIPANDSIFVFLELYADPNNDPQSLPLIIRDSIQIFTNGAEQKVMLIAWGRDAHYFKYYELPADEVWSDQTKPYVIYGYVYVPEGKTFTINEGVNIFLSPQSWIYVEGKLSIEGTLNSPVMMEGDRLQPDYENRAGQWGGIWIDNPSTGNEITHARLKNGTVGIYVDSMDNLQDVNVIVRNTEVKNMSFDGIAVRHGNIIAENTIAHNCGRFTYFSQYGGVCWLRHCTFASYGRDFTRNDPTFVLSNTRRDALGNLLQNYSYNFRVENTIIDGYKDMEYGRDIIPYLSEGVSVQNCLLKSTDDSLSNSEFQNIFNQDPSFIDGYNGNFRLNTNSPAIDSARKFTPAVLRDFEEKVRGIQADIGAFEL